MILDTGICSVFTAQDYSVGGEKPSDGYVLLGQSWYKELTFETSPARPTERRFEQLTDQRIRILQNRKIRQDDVVILRNITDFNRRDLSEPVYRITRAYHGPDESGTTPITDLSLEVFTP